MCVCVECLYTGVFRGNVRTEDLLVSGAGRLILHGSLSLNGRRKIKVAVAVAYRTKNPGCCSFRLNTHDWPRLIFSPASPALQKGGGGGKKEAKTANTNMYSTFTRTRASGGSVERWQIREEKKRNVTSALPLPSRCQTLLQLLTLCCMN